MSDSNGYGVRKCVVSVFGKQTVNFVHLRLPIENKPGVTDALESNGDDGRFEWLLF
jgi:hypothetical protein